MVLNTGRRLTAQIVGTAPALDMAVLHVELTKDEYQPMSLGNSDDLPMGQKVVAVGRPIALHDALTVGVVSALGRALSALSVELQGEIIQTDAAVNPVNSGGPLINSRGEVVGIVAAFIEGAQGVGFAIPVNFAKRVNPGLVDDGPPLPPWPRPSRLRDYT